MQEQATAGEIEGEGVQRRKKSDTTELYPLESVVHVCFG